MTDYEIGLLRSTTQYVHVLSHVGTTPNKLTFYQACMVNKHYNLALHTMHETLRINFQTTPIPYANEHTLAVGLEKVKQFTL